MAKKSNRLFTYSDNNQLIDTILKNNNPIFVEYKVGNDEINYIKSIELDNNTYNPIKSTNSFLTTGVLKIANDLENYESKEKIIEEIKSYIKKYVDCSNEFLIISSYYVFFSYFYRKYEEVPYLRVIGDYGSGKSRLLKTVGSVCYSSIFMNGSASLASIFRVMEMVKGTLVFDEADISKSDTSNELIKILNNGYQKGMPVFRAEGDDFDPKAFDVFCPKIIGGRMEFSDKATESRCLSEIMKSTKRTDIGELDEEFERLTMSIRNKMLKYKFDNYLSFKPDLDRYKLEGLEPRLKQVLRPILSVIDNKKEAEILINYMKKKQIDMIKDRQLSVEGQLFDFLEKLIKRDGKHKVHLNDLVAHLSEEHKYLTSRKIGSILRQHGINEINRDGMGMYLDLVKSKDKIKELVIKFGLDEEIGKQDYDFPFPT